MMRETRVLALCGYVFAIRNSQYEKWSERLEMRQSGNGIGAVLHLQAVSASWVNFKRGGRKSGQSSISTGIQVGAPRALVSKCFMLDMSSRVASKVELEMHGETMR